jgi:subtilisin family serine protease
MRKLGLAVSTAAILSAALLLALAGPAQSRSAATLTRYVVVAKSAADYAALRQDVTKAGGIVTRDLREVNALAVAAPDGFAAAIRSDPHAKGVAKDHLETLINPTRRQDLVGTATGGRARQTRISGALSPGRSMPGDPAFSLPGLLWNVGRVNAFNAWGTTTGSKIVTVGVADTGLDYTHSELASQVVGVHDFTVDAEDVVPQLGSDAPSQKLPAICPTFFDLPTDQELAVDLGAPAADLDFNGHGSWIGGNIAAAVNQSGINGIAPNVKLFSLKISQNCGSAYDVEEIIPSFLFAANNGIDVVSISFGGYLDRSDPDQDLVYQLYQQAVNYALGRGTAIVAAAGNEHVRVGAGGQVLSHGSLGTATGGPDLFGQWEIPGGIPGVVDVSSSGNVVNAPSAECPADALAAGTFTWCKPTSDRHQPVGVGRQNQLAYYSDYGPRIDVAGAGGARKFNLPLWDRGGTPGWPYTGIDSLFGGTSVADGFNAWQDFSITSNWATEIDCFTLEGITRPPGGGADSTSPDIFPEGQCYATIQGTSMATPHASAVLALIASSHLSLRHQPRQLIQILKSTATRVTGNTTPPMNLLDTSPADLTGEECPGGPDGACHLGGAPIPDAEAYGAGLVNAGRAVIP